MDEDTVRLRERGQEHLEETVMTCDERGSDEGVRRGAQIATLVTHKRATQALVTDRTENMAM